MQGIARLCRSKNVRAFIALKPVTILLIAVTVSTILGLNLVLRHTSFFVGIDNIGQFYAWYQKLAIDIHHGILPIWNVSQFSGQSFAGDLQPGVFYPLNLLFVAIFGSVHGVSEGLLNAYMVFNFILGATGMYLLLKEMGCRWVTAYAGGLLYVFSGSVAARSTAQTVVFIGLCLLPYPLYFLVKYHNHKTRNLWYLALAGLFLGLIILSGHVDSIYFSLLTLFFFELYFLYKGINLERISYRKVISSVKHYLFIIAIAAVVSLPQLYISAQYLPHSYRWELNGYSPINHISYTEYSTSFILNPSDIANIINPRANVLSDSASLFIGLLPLAFIIVALVIARKAFKESKLWKSYGLIFVVLGVIGLLSMLGYWTWFAVLLYKIPLLSQIREPVRYEILLQLALVASFVAAYEALQTHKTTKKQSYILISLAAFFAIDSIYVFMLRASKFGFSTSYAIQLGLLAVGLFVIGATKDNLRKYSLLGLILLTLLGNSILFLPKNNAGTMTTASYVLPASLISRLQATSGKYRVDIEDSTMPVNSGDVFGFQAVGGYGATVYSPYYDVQQSQPFVEHVLTAPRPSATSNMVSQSTLSDLLGVKYVVISIPSVGDNEKLAYQNPAHHVYLAQRETVLSKIFTYKKAGSILRSNYSSLKVTTNIYNDAEQKYTVYMSKSEPVVISEIQYPGWKLTVNGHSEAWKPYYIANTPLLRTFNLPKGTDTVVFSYKPFG